MNSLPKTHLLLDFFGTLVEYSPDPVGDGYRRTYDIMRHAGYSGTHEQFVALWSGIYAELEADARRTHREFTMHDQATAVLERSLGHAEQRLTETLAETYLTDWNRGVVHIDGVAEMIKDLAQSYTLAVVSNTHDAALVPAHLSAMKVDQLFKAVVISAELGVRKPNSAIFEYALARLNSEPAQCVYVGDSFDADYKGAENAGLACFLIDPAREAGIPEEHRLMSIFDLPSRLRHSIAM